MKNTVLSLACFCTFGAFAAAPYIAPTADMFYDDFSSGELDTNRWFAANKNWGGINKDTKEDYNGGVVPENLYVRDNILQCEAHGNWYDGEVIGIHKNGTPTDDGKRVGACAVTKDYFASGSYEIRAKVAPSKGVCCTMWTFEYEELYKGDEGAPSYLKDDEYFVINHEIDIEMPGRPLPEHKNISYEYALCNTWIGENEGEYTASHMKLPAPQDDGEFHTYRFDWHTGDKAGTNIPRVEFYFDGVPVVTNYTHVPSKAGRLWVGAWFPNGWAGDPEFETDVFQVDYVKIIPFHEENDQPQNETYGSDGLSVPLNIVPPRSWKVGTTDEGKSVLARLYDDGSLYFYGKGSVKDYAEGATPWMAYAADITTVVFSNCIELAEHTLDGLPNLTTINGGPLSTRTTTPGYVFYDDFSSETVDPQKWFAACDNWDSWHTYWSGGVTPENLYVRDGVLQCEAHGDLYEGEIMGYDEGDNPRRTRVGACAVTRDYFASGRYEVRAKAIPVLGVCSAMWTRTQVDGKTNKIELQMPGRPQEGIADIAYDYALCFNQTNDNKYTSTKSYAKLAEIQNDGQFHDYRFDWHTGNKSGTITPRIDFYVDGVKVATNTAYVPTKASRFWIGAWFPKEWSGESNFDTYVYEVDWVRITPFFEENDEENVEKLPYSGMLETLNVVPPPLWEVGVDTPWAVMARLNEKGELVLSGTGAVTNFTSVAETPWAGQASEITSVIVRDGVTKVDTGSLLGLYGVSTVNGTELSRYKQVMYAAGRGNEVPATQTAPQGKVTANVYQSTDLKSWTKIPNGLTLSTDGKSVRIPIDPADQRRFFKLVTE